jgi:hypothetical protein
MAVDGRLAEREVGEAPPQHVEDARHHQLAVGERERLRPADRLYVVPEQVGALRQVGEVGIGQRDEPALRLALGALDEVAADAVADAARTSSALRPCAGRITAP